VDDDVVVGGEVSGLNFTVMTSDVTVMEVTVTVFVSVVMIGSVAHVVVKRVCVGDVTVCVTVTVWTVGMRLVRTPWN